MGMDPGRGSRDLGNQRWRSEQDMIDGEAQRDHMAHEVEKAHERDDAEHGIVHEPKRPWWKFWG
jgi:hypothetical protein